jgi:hypothetical protein
MKTTVINEEEMLRIIRERNDLFKVIFRLTGYDTPVTGGNGRPPSRHPPSPPVYLLSSGRDVPIDRFSHPIFPFQSGAGRAPFLYTKR